MNKPVDFVQEVIKKLKLNIQAQTLVTLSMLESSEDLEAFNPENPKIRYTETYQNLVKFFRQKLVDFNQNSKADQLPEYAAHRILFLIDSIDLLVKDQTILEIKQNFTHSLQSKFS
jgi:hypothetical protein